MKKIILILLSVCCLQMANAQSDTSKVEQYCKLTATPRLLSTKVTIDVDFGESRKLFQDTRMRDEAGKLAKFNGVVDALNYLGAQGWTIVNAFPVLVNNTMVYHYYFKRYVSKKELE